MHILSNVKLYLEDKWEKKKNKWKTMKMAKIFGREKEGKRRRIKQNLLGRV